MFWRLTLLAACLAAATLAAANPVLAQATRSRPSRAVRATTHSVHWDGIELGDAIERMRRASGADIFVDRRVDPNRRVTLSVDEAPTQEILEQLAVECGLGVGRIGTLLYLGPQEVAKRLASVAAERRRDAARIPEELRRSLAQRKTIAWPRLTEPRDLIVRLAAEHGWKIDDADRIAFDLWPAGELPRMALADQLTVLLAGFDLTFRPDSAAAIKLELIDWSAVAQPAPASTPDRRTTTRGAEKQVFTLRVQEQPVGAVLTQIAKRLDWKLEVDENALRAAGRSMDTRVSFAVENADADQLLNALLVPAGLKAMRTSDRVRILPR